MYRSNLSLTSAIDGVGGQRYAPAALPLGKTRYALYKRLDGPQSRSGPVRKISYPPGFDPRNVQPVTSRYTDYTVPAPASFNSLFKGLPSFSPLVYNQHYFWHHVAVHSCYMS
jgi:hypothetical protein